jgi:hypothetical protein
MREHTELQEHLLAGLPDDERAAVREVLHEAQAQQLYGLEHPARRRQRDDEGVLQPLEAGPGE